jgi:hypothetical protein
MLRLPFVCIVQHTLLIRPVKFWEAGMAKSRISSASLILLWESTRNCPVVLVFWNYMRAGPPFAP